MSCGNAGGGSAKAAGGGGKSIVDGGGVAFTKDGSEFVYEQINGEMYDVSDLADIPTKAPLSGSEMVERMANNGTDFRIMSPEQMQQRRDARQADRNARAGIDYELGVGVPWGNKNQRQAARRGRMISRAQKRRK